MLRFLIGSWGVGVSLPFIHNIGIPTLSSSTLLSLHLCLHPLFEHLLQLDLVSFCLLRNGTSTTLVRCENFAFTISGFSLMHRGYSRHLPAYVIRTISQQNLTDPHFPRKTEETIIRHQRMWKTRFGATSHTVSDTQRPSVKLFRA
jgi:hypothetical protein